MQLSDCYYLGKITKKHGFKGNLVLFLDTDEPQKYHQLESILIEEKGVLVPFFIEEISVPSPQKLIIKLEGVRSEEQAEHLVNKAIYLPLNTLPKLSGNQFYYHEIIGFELYDNNSKQTVGTIINVIDHTAQALLEIKANNKNRLIPIVDDWIAELNRDKKQLIMLLPEGLLELE